MTFAPFSIRCPTCDAQLRVTNPALAGTIANCPKCHSLVEIIDPHAASNDEPPTPGTSTPATSRPDSPTGADRMSIGADPVDSEAVTRDGVEPPESIDPNLSPRGFASDPDDRSPSHTGGPFPPPGSGVPGSAAPGDVIAPPAWQSERTQRTRHVALVATISIAGLIVTAALFAWFVHSWTGTTREVASNDATATGDAAADVDGDSSDGEPNADSQPNLDGRRGDDPRDDPTQGPTENAATTEDEDADADASDDDVPDDAATSERPDATEDAAPENGSVVPGDSRSTIPSDLLPESPLSGLTGPAGPGPPTGPVAPSGPVAPTGPRRPPSDADEGGGMTELPAGLSQYTVLLGLGQEEGNTTAKIAPPTAADEVEIETPAEETVDPMMEANPLPRIDLRRTLSTEMAFASDGYPFSDFALVIGQLTGAPVEIDWVSFDLIGVDIRDPVPTSQEMITAAEHLDRVAAAVGAEVISHDQMVRVTPTDETFRKALGPRMTLDDFGDGRDTAADVLAEFLGEPDDDDAVRWGNDRTEWQLAAFAVETLRRIRDRPAAMPDKRFLRWAGPADGMAPWRPLTGGDPGDPLETAVTVSQLLRQTARRNGATCVINWADALRRRMAANRTVMPHPDSDAADLIAETLDPLGLQVRKVSEDAWWLGTEATYDRLPVVVWTEPLGDRRDRIEQRLVSLMGQPGSDTFRYAHDPITDRAIILLPRFIVRQFPTILTDDPTPTPRTSP